MRKLTYLFALIAAISWTGVQAQTDDQNQDGNDTRSHLYLGIGATSLALDNDRVPGVPTSSPSHTSKLGSLILGYQFNDLWAVDASFGTDLSDNVDTDAFAVNGYRFFGTGGWRPYISAGLSSFAIDDAPDDDSQQVQAGFGVSGALNRNLELRVGYQHHFTINDESFQDKAIGAALAWHFRKPEPTTVSQAEPQAEPQPESVPAEKEVVETIELRVQFDFDKSVVKSAYEPQFQELAEALEENPDKTITIEGHTCWIGTEEYNQGLSERRANAVKQKLVEDYGVDPGRLDTKGYGEARPVADNSTLAGRRQNRRAIAVIMQTRTVTE